MAAATPTAIDAKRYFKTLLACRSARDDQIERSSQSLVHRLDC